MPSAGYSGKSLLKKLGIQSQHKVLVIHAPAEYNEWLEHDIAGQLAGKKDLPDVVHLFAKDMKTFLTDMEKLQAVYQKNPKLVIWVSWYKKSSGKMKDIGENDIRNWAIQHGLVDVKVCAVSDEWSGLKLVVPLKKC